MKFFTLTDEFLRGEGRFSAEASVTRRLRWLVAFVIVFGGLYGVVMSSFTGMTAERWHQMAYVGAKVPLMLLATFLLCLPNFFVINTLAGLREDFALALRGVVAAQACVTIALGALAPLTVFVYLCWNINYDMAIVFNGGVFAVATASSYVVIRRYYAPLIAKSRRHLAMLYAWLVLYVFVGIQMGWILKPFIGDPNVPVVFFRQGEWGNPYLVILSLFGQIWRYATGG